MTDGVMVGDMESELLIKPVVIPGEGGKEFVPTDVLPLYMTDSALKAVHEAIAAEQKAGSGIRVSVVGGGCAGYQYNLGFEDTARSEDCCFQLGELNFFLDPISDCYLRGTVIDYVSSEKEQGFRFHNPNPRRRCACGSATG